MFVLQQASVGWGKGAKRRAHVAPYRVGFAALSTTLQGRASESFRVTRALAIRLPAGHAKSAAACTKAAWFPSLSKGDAGNFICS